MRGILKDVALCHLGSEVAIVVDSHNHPTGIWRGRLVAVGEVRDTFQHGDAWAECEARITDRNAPELYQDKEPDVRYHAYAYTQGFDALLHRIKKANDEIAGLKKRLEIERATFQSLFKSLVSEGALAKFEKLVSDLLARLGK